MGLTDAAVWVQDVWDSDWDSVRADDLLEFHQTTKLTAAAYERSLHMQRRGRGRPFTAKTPFADPVRYPESDRSDGCRTILSLLRRTVGVPDHVAGTAARCASISGTSSIEIYVTVRQAANIWRHCHYDPMARCLTTRSYCDAQEFERSGALERHAGADCFVHLGMMRPRSEATLGVRGYRLAILDAGAMLQVLRDTVAQLQIVSDVVTTFFDNRIERLLGMDGISELYLVSVCLEGV